MRTTALGAPRHLKKAWLQRHTGEDSEDTTGITGGGSCVKLPLTITPPLSTTSATTLSTVTNATSATNNTTNNEQSQASTVTSTATTTSVTRSSPPLTLHAIGSMAINSINKTKTSGKRIGLFF